jgi:hypothetical protein
MSVPVAHGTLLRLAVVIERALARKFAQLPTVFRQDKALTSLGGKPLFVL